MICYGYWHHTADLLAEGTSLVKHQLTLLCQVTKCPLNLFRSSQCMRTALIRGWSLPQNSFLCTASGREPSLLNNYLCTKMIYDISHCYESQSACCRTSTNMLHYFCY